MLFNNKKNEKQFTDLLYELVVKRNLSVTEALYVIKGENRTKKLGKVQKAGGIILENLKMGMNLSMALKVCTEIRFEESFISFIGFAEKTGNMKEVLDFLRKRLVRNQENRERLVEALAYPVFVICLAVVLVLVLISYWGSVMDGESVTPEMKKSIVYGFVSSFSVLIVFCAIAFAVLKRIFQENPLFEAFLAAGFLTKAGFGMSEAVGVVASILSPESRESVLFENARMKLSEGIGLDEAFDFSTGVGSNKAFVSEVKRAFYYAQFTGDGNDAFEKIAYWLESRETKRRRNCFKLIEPIFVLGTGIFLMSFLMNLVTPFLNSTLLF